MEEDPYEDEDEEEERYEDELVEDDEALLDEPPERPFAMRAMLPKTATAAPILAAVLEDDERPEEELDAYWRLSYSLTLS